MNGRRNSDRPASGERPGVQTTLKWGTATVWLVFGVIFKILGLVPRHRMIVASIVGAAAAGPVTVLIGGVETAVGLWILTGFKPRACAAVQTVAIVSMNVLELGLARDLLLSPVLMLCGNAVLLCLVWYWALHASTAARSL